MTDYMIILVWQAIGPFGMADYGTIWYDRLWDHLV